MKNNTAFTNGYSLIEVLVAVAILMFSIVGPMTIASKSVQSAQFAKQQTTAFFLAQEGITLTEVYRHSNALATYKNSSISAWAWISDPLFAPCRTALGCNFSRNDGGGIARGVNVDDNLKACTSALPGPLEPCTLKYDPSNLSGYTLPYHTQTNGDPASIYKRIIKWNWNPATPDELLVTSTVEWNSVLLGGKQSVTQSTSLFNRYQDLGL
jgi:type II secretory pathway pseudopilin PulG